MVFAEGLLIFIVMLVVTSNSVALMTAEYDPASNLGIHCSPLRKWSDRIKTSFLYTLTWISLSFILNPLLAVRLNVTLSHELQTEVKLETFKLGLRISVSTTVSKSVLKIQLSANPSKMAPPSGAQLFSKMQLTADNS